MFQIQHQKLAGTPTQEVYIGFARYIQRFTPDTQRSYTQTLVRFIQSVPPFYEQITMEHIERFIQSFGKKNSSKNSALFRIRSFCKYAEDYLGLPNPAEKVKPFKVHFYEQRVITEIEYSKILEVCKPKERAVIQFLANSGLRRTEFRLMSTANLSPDKTFITVIGKGKKRKVPINQVCREALSHLDLTKSYKNEGSLAALCRKLSRKSGIKVNPHCFRHYFATRMIKAGVPIAILSKILGHKNEIVTAIVYCHIFDSDCIGSTDCLVE